MNHLRSRPPAGYPADFERQVTLDDGRRVAIRPIVPDDDIALELAIEQADSDTLYQRFFRGGVHLDAAQLARLTRLDYEGRMALAAFDASDDGVGIARYEILEPGVAEIAVATDPGWRRVGLGTVLVQFLEEAAAERGIHTLTAVHLPENRRIAGLLENLGFQRGPNEDGLATSSKQLVPAA